MLSSSFQVAAENQQLAAKMISEATDTVLEGKSTTKWSLQDKAQQSLTGKLLLCSSRGAPVICLGANTLRRHLVQVHEQSSLGC